MPPGRCDVSISAKTSHTSDTFVLCTLQSLLKISRNMRVHGRAVIKIRQGRHKSFAQFKSCKLAEEIEAVYSLNFFRQFTKFELRNRRVSALALSHLDYCSTVYSNISVDLKEKLQRAQNECIRYVTILRKDAHVTPARR